MNIHICNAIPIRIVSVLGIPPTSDLQVKLSGEFGSRTACMILYPVTLPLRSHTYHSWFNGVRIYIEWYESYNKTHTTYIDLVAKRPVWLGGRLCRLEFSTLAMNL